LKYFDWYTSKEKFHTVGYCGCGLWHYANEEGRPMYKENGEWRAGRKYPKTPDALRLK
jgi:hypothetical protein